MPKKTFANQINPAMQFISQTQETASNAPETKSRRLQLLIRPSLHAKLKARAAKEGKSLNELINELLDDCVGRQS